LDGTQSSQGIVSGGKGIGKGIVKYYVQRPNTIVVAAVRTPSSTEAKALTGFKTADGSKVILVKIDATSPTDGINAMKTLTALHGINRLDIVIANAGIFEATANQKVADLKLKDLQQHIDVNTYGVIRLFQSTWPLLSKSKKPIFLLNSAGAATMGGMKTYALPTHFVCRFEGASKFLRSEATG
jgi:norsolorinic acid ketoreductase